MKNLFQRVFYSLIVRPILAWIIGVRYENTDALKGMKQFIMVANHNSHFDSVSLMTAIPGKMRIHTHMVAASDYWGQNKRSRRLMDWFFNSILISRSKEKDAPSPIKQMDTLLKQGKSLILFPEGTRGEPGTIGEFKKGVAILLKENPEVPFIPVYLNGFGRVLPRNTWLILPLVCKIRIGEPQWAYDDNIEETLEQIREGILSLKKEGEKDFNQFLYT